MSFVDWLPALMFVLLLAASMSILIRVAVRLWGPAHYAAATRTDAHSSDTHSPFG